MARDGKRLFFALRPNTQVRERMVALQKGLLSGTKIRAVSAENLHMTLVFVGKVADQQIPDLSQCADKIQINPFEMLLDRCGHWRRPQICWLGCQPGIGPLERLVDDLKARLNDCLELKLDERFVPHVTLARKIRLALPERQFEPIPWFVNDFHLMESVSGAKGVSYRSLAKWPLASRSAGV